MSIKLRMIINNYRNLLERFSYDLEMITREQNKNNKRTRKVNVRLAYRTESNARGF